MEKLLRSATVCSSQITTTTEVYGGLVDGVPKLWRRITIEADGNSWMFEAPVEGWTRRFFGMAALNAYDRRLRRTLRGVTA